MGLGGYRSYRQEYVDTGEEWSTTIHEEVFRPEFKNSNTIQVWNISANLPRVVIEEWQNSSLQDRSLHTIEIVNNAGGQEVEVAFNTLYLLEDESVPFDPSILLDRNYESIILKSGDRAYFYATGLNVANKLVLSMRKGSKDNR